MGFQKILLLALILVSTAAKAAGTVASLSHDNNVIETDDAIRARVRRLEEEQARLLEQLKKTISSDPASQAKAELDRIVAKIKEETMNRTESLYITSSTPIRGPAAKRYVNEVVARIEDCGTEHFPRQDGSKLYGTGIFYFAIDRTGRLVDQRVLKTTGIPALDIHAEKLIQATAPYGAVPVQMHKNFYSKFIFVRNFSFKKSEDSATPPAKRHCQFDG